MTDVEEIRGKSKAIAAAKISATAKLAGITMLIHGVRSVAEVMALTGLPRSTVYRAQSEYFEAGFDCPTRPTGENPTSLTCPTSETSENPTDGNCSEKTVSLVPPVRLEPSRVIDNTSLTSLEDSSESKNPLPPTKTKSGPTPMQALEAFEAYNATALRCGLPQATKLTPDRQRKIAARLREYGAEGWAAALANIEKSSFLTGTNDRGWRASLEFLLQPASFAKVHDGGYGNGRHQGAAEKPKPKVLWEPWMAEAQEYLRS